MKEHDGWWFPDADDFMWREMKNGGYQADHLNAALAFVTDFRCAIDGGAHVGVWSKAMADKFEHVVAFEPAADTFACLVKNMADIDTVDALAIALGARAGFVSMSLVAKQAERKNTGGRFTIQGGKIRMMTLDELRLSALGFLKLDIEGGEPDALTGAAETIDRCKPVVLFEDKGFCERYGYPRDASQELLESLGYEHRARVGHDEIWTARA